MDTMSERVVAGVFLTQTQAEAASRRLQQIGLEEGQIEIGVPEPGRYRIESDEAAALGRGVVRGVIAGIVAGGLVGVGFVLLTVPGALGMGMNGLGLGLLVGIFWGIFFGGLGGMVPAVLAQEHATGWYVATESSPETIVIAHAGGLAGRAERAMQKAGAKAFLAQAPAVHPAHPIGAVHQYA